MAWIGVSYKKGVVTKQIDKDGGVDLLKLGCQLFWRHALSNQNGRLDSNDCRWMFIITAAREGRQEGTADVYPEMEGGGMGCRVIHFSALGNLKQHDHWLLWLHLICVAVLLWYKKIFQTPLFSDLISAGHRKGVWCQCCHYWMWRAMDMMDCWEERRSHPGRNGSRVERRRGWKDAKSEVAVALRIEGGWWGLGGEVNTCLLFREGAVAEINVSGAEL